MPEFPETRHSLLVRVQQDDGDAWDEFSNVYRPVIYSIARRRGWQDADAQDVAQQVLLKVAAALPQFGVNQDRARFRTWLTTICRNALIDELRRTKSRAQPLDDIGALIPTFDLTEEEISNEHRRQVFRWAAKKAADAFAASTWQAFWRTSVDGTSSNSVAQELNMSVGAVYTARSRVMQYLKQKVQEYDDAEL